jgi:hypothetical protein
LEDVDHDEAAVVEKVLDAFFNEVVVCICEFGDAAGGVDAVYVGYYLYGG